MAATERRSTLRTWMLQDLSGMGRADGLQGPHAKAGPPHRGQPWYRVLCLSGVDYFSTLGYQPGIAALAAGLLSPVATLVLVIVTLAGALPVYRRVAEESPHGQGSIAMLERMLRFWKGKLFVLTLLGFAATDFLITITLSSADASVHLVENPHLAGALHGKQMVITLGLIALLGAVFLRGFLDAIGTAVVLVGIYLSLNGILVLVGWWHVVTEGHVVTDWSSALSADHGNVFVLIGMALVVFPKLALGLSGFETGVAVMPHVRGAATDTEKSPAGRIRQTKKLLTTAALVMSFFLVSLSFLTTLLIPAQAFDPGGAANGRAAAYLAHAYLGNAFGTLYDFSTIAILWFAGASAMAGLLNLMPRYLPRYGMAPHWAAAVRPMVLVFTFVGFLVTWVFGAEVDAQSGAYATGVLVLISSAAIAVTIAARRAGQRRWLTFTVISAVFLYTMVLNVFERPDGVKIGGCFIAGIMLVSFLSRIVRAFELRVEHVELDPMAERFVRDISRRGFNFIAHEPGGKRAEEYRDRIERTRAANSFASPDDFVFVEVTVSDPSEFQSSLSVRGQVVRKRYRVLCLEGPSDSNALAAFLLHARDVTGRTPHIYFEWTEGNPFVNVLRFLLFGHGEVAAVTREVLRIAEPNRARRPRVHVS